MLGSWMVGARMLGSWMVGARDQNNSGETCISITNIDRRISLYDFLGQRWQKAIEFNCKSCYEHISQGCIMSILQVCYYAYPIAVAIGGMYWFTSGPCWIANVIGTEEIVTEARNNHVEKPRQAKAPSTSHLELWSTVAYIYIYIYII